MWLSKHNNTYGVSEVTLRREGDNKVIGWSTLRFRVERMYNEAGSGRPQVKITAVNG